MRRTSAPLRQKSERRAEVEDPLWRATKALKLETDPQCQFFIVEMSGRHARRCRKPARDVHHVAGRGRHLCTWIYLMSVCREHHDWIEEHRTQAEALGYIFRDRSPYDPALDSRKSEQSHLRLPAPLSTTIEPQCTQTAPIIPSSNK